MTAADAEPTATTQQSNSFQILTCLTDRSGLMSGAVVFSHLLCMCLRFSVSSPALHSSAFARKPLVSMRLTVCKRIFFISACNSFIYENQLSTDSYELFSRNHSTAVITSLEPQLNPGVCYFIIFVIYLIFLYLRPFCLLQTALVPGKSVKQIFS